MQILLERAAAGRRAVYRCRKKITVSDRISDLLNRRVLAGVRESCILSTMGDQNTGKLNRLLAELGDTRLVSSRWLRAHGYSNSLVARYFGSGWLARKTIMSENPDAERAHYFRDIKVVDTSEERR